MRNPRRSIAAGAIFLAAAIVCSACGSSATSSSSDSGSLQTLTIANPGDVGLAPLDYALGHSEFKKAGINLQQVTFSASNVLSQLLSGQTNIAVGGGGNIVQYLSRGEKLVVLAGSLLEGSTQATASDAIVASKASGVTSLSQLAGKTVALPSINGSGRAYTSYNIRLAGVNPSTVKFVALPSAAMLPALQRNQIQAADMEDPYRSQALQAGMTWLSPAHITDYTEYMFTTAAFAASHQALLANFVKVLSGATSYANQNWSTVRSYYIQFEKLSAADAQYTPKIATFAAQVKLSDLQTNEAVMKDDDQLGDKPVDLSAVIFKS